MFLKEEHFIYPVCFTPVTALNSEEENDPPTYKEAFPPLPEKAPCLEAAQEPSGPWSKIRPIKASVITQVGGSGCLILFFSSLLKSR